MDSSTSRELRWVFETQRRRAVGPLLGNEEILMERRTGVVHLTNRVGRHYARKSSASSRDLGYPDTIADALRLRADNITS